MAHTTCPSLVVHTLSLAAALGVLACHGLTATPIRAATPSCTAAAAQAAAPPGMTIGPITDLNPALPLTWNHKLLFSGCGGYCGVVFQSPPNDARGGGFPPDALAKGYAIAATDDGHASTPVGLIFDGTWALTAPGVAHEDAVTDFFSRAVHTVTVAGKQFVQHWYAGALA
jgi:Tannase and feruloyl esterase